MEPMVAIALAKKLADVTGVSDWLGNLLGGSKAAKVAGDVLDIASGITKEKNPEDALTVIQQDPAKAFELKKRLISHKERLLELANEDRANARAMQAQALKQSDPGARLFIYRFAWFWAVIVCAYLGSITFIEIPKENIRFADNILGFILGTVVATILQFFFGSSFQRSTEDG